MQAGSDEGRKKLIYHSNNEVSKVGKSVNIQDPPSSNLLRPLSAIYSPLRTQPDLSVISLGHVTFLNVTSGLSAPLNQSKRQ